MTSAASPAFEPAASTWLDRRFAFRARGSDVRTEVLAGFTTFFTMAYVVVVNPAILGMAGMPIAGVATATCIGSLLACLIMGFLADVPVAMAPGMGLNAYFSFTVVQQMHLPWQVGLVCVFLSGLFFLVLTRLGVRQMVMSVIPHHLLAAVAAGIGMFIALIGLKNAGIVVANPETIVALGKMTAPGPLLSLVGLALIMALTLLGVRGAILISILVTTVIGIATGMAPVAAAHQGWADMGSTILALDPAWAWRLFGHGWGVLEVVFVFLFVDLFENIGTLVAVTRKAGLVRPDGSIPGLNRMLYADSISSMIGALLGTTTVTSYVESATGVEVGGRSGLTAVITGLLFLVALPFAPYAQLVPLAATAPALIVVGALMMAPLIEIDWNKSEEAIPAFLALVMIPLTFSIANGLAFGITAHALIKALRREFTRENALLFVLAVLFVFRFAYIAGV
ncbi:NCS2 family permease [Novosphingobium sp. Fuku2-ISO-50]|uniref:NCS2 family permease n=1 Tax=Novosphingobium sp. Fuku2-ISO-50 TaxID=1739114 RepID=UPI0009E93D5F|nr:NCS2 family permease [Novosphingobium sp. Fuku2-ISO-50]